MNKTHKGYLLAILSVILAAAAPVFAKIVIDASNIETTGLFWFLSASIGSGLILFYKKRYKLVVPTLKKFPKTWIILIFLFLASYILWLFSVKKIGPVNTDFVTLIGVVYMMGLGVTFLKEKFNIKEIIGSILAILGIFVITFNPGEYLGLKIIFILASTLIWNTSRFIIKKKIHHIEPIVFVFIRAILIFILLTAYIIFFGEFIKISGMVLLIALIVPFFTAVLQHLTMFQAYKYCDFSKLAVITTLSPFIVIFYSFALFGFIPYSYQLLGGGLIVIGVIVLKLKKTNAARN